MKTCARCDHDLPATPEYFYRYGRSRDGLSPWCKPCAAAAHREWKRRMKGGLVWRKSQQSSVTAYWFSPYRLVWDRCILACDYRRKA